MKEARARRARFERLQREALIQQRAEATLRQAFLMNQEKAAKAIQVSAVGGIGDDGVVGAVVPASLDTV